MVFKIFGGLCGYLLMGVILEVLLRPALKLPPELGFTDDLTAFAIAVPMLIAGFVIGFDLTARRLKRR